MSTHQEDRIYKHYQSKRHQGKHGAGYAHDPNDDRLILFLAKHWKMSCKQIKTIVRYFQRKNKAAHTENIP